MDVDKFKIHFTTERLHIKLENLFNGDKTLGEYTFIHNNLVI